MLILGILAAIAIPAFFSQRDKSSDADAKATVRTAQTAMETCSVDKGGTYVGCTDVALKAIEPTLPAANAATGVKLAAPTNVTADSYTLVQRRPRATRSRSPVPPAAQSPTPAPLQARADAPRVAAAGSLTGDPSFGSSVPGRQRGGHKPASFRSSGHTDLRSPFQLPIFLKGSAARADG